MSQSPIISRISLRLIRSHKLDGAQREARTVRCCTANRFLVGGTKVFPELTPSCISKVYVGHSKRCSVLYGIGDYAGAAEFIEA